MRLVRWTLSFLSPYRARVVGVGALSVVEIALAALAPWPLKIVVDSVLGDHPLPDPIPDLLRSTVGESAVALLVTVVVAGLFVQVGQEAVRLVLTQLQVDMGQRIVYRLRAQLLSHLQALPLGQHVLSRTADSVYRLDADAHCVNDLVIGGVFPLALQPSTSQSCSGAGVSGLDARLAVAGRRTLSLSVPTPLFTNDDTTLRAREGVGIDCHRAGVRGVVVDCRGKELCTRASRGSRGSPVRATRRCARGSL